MSDTDALKEEKRKDEDQSFKNVKKNSTALQQGSGNHGLFSS